MRGRIVLLAALAAGWVLSGSALAVEPRPLGKASGAQCVECHESEARTHVHHGECTSCHVTADKHASDKKPKLVRPGMPESRQCLSCHETDKRRMHFSIAEHNTAGVQCSDCHGLHSSKVKKLGAGEEKGGKVTALCATCHQDVVARFSMTSHHPVKEGGVACTGCHDPHASKQATLGAATETCTKCHQAVRGPHTFEHAPVAEDCTVCHDPHGSPNKRLLQTAQPMQCLQCHAPPGNRHGQGGAVSTASTISGAVLRDCVGCHNAIHGSASDQHLRF
jgi:DmsE family decaheme c-type cytochrome